MGNLFEWDRDILGESCSAPRDGSPCHSESSKHKEKLKAVQYILEAELAGTVNELNMRNEGTRDPVQY